MSTDAEYKPVEYIYKSRGLVARYIDDQAPEYTYLQVLNCLERAEDSMSSRYGTQIINRDPAGTGTANHYFSSPITSLARLSYQGDIWRYAGDSAGNLYRRTGDTQGAYALQTLPVEASGSAVVLSGSTFQTLVDNCFETSQAYIFIYDQNASIKDMGSGTVQLTGIDPSPYTINSNPYSPLLSIIDSFAQGNAYTTVGITSWGWANIETLTASSGQLITDFSQFYGILPSGGGGTSYTPTTATTTASISHSGLGSSTGFSTSVTGFASVVPSFGETVSLYVTTNGQITISPSFDGGGGIQYEYSTDAGVTWTTFYSNNSTGNSQTFTPTSVSTTVSVSNLNLLQARVFVTAAGASPAANTSVQGTITNAYAVVSNPTAFGPVANGMLSILNTNTSIAVPISNVQSTAMTGGIYTQLLVTTSTPHGLSVGSLCSVYATSNDTVDGFYEVLSTPTSTTFTVAFDSGSGASAINGFVYGGAAAPAVCILADQYSSPYPSQMTAYGFYQWVPPTTTSFPVGAWSGTVASGSTGYVNKSVILDLSQNNQVTNDDLIVITLLVSDPSAIGQIELQFYVGTNSGPSYYTKFISQAYYQGSIDGSEDAYSATESQILADTLGLITGAPPNTTTAQLQPSNISTGAGSWIACYLRRGDFLPVGQAGSPGLDWASVVGWQLNVTTNTTASCSFSVNGLYLQWGYGPSSFGGVGYDYRQTYYNANTGTESSPNPIQEFNEQYGYLSSQAAPIYLRQAAQLQGQYSFDPQVTHTRIYRRGGTLSSNWFLVDQIPNVTGGGQFVYKDVTADAFLEEASPLILDNDPPVTSSLLNPIQTTLVNATSGAGQSIYSTFLPQAVTVTQSGAVFVPNQIVDVGSASNIEQVMVITGGVGTFTAMFRLQHNANEAVNVYAVPRQPCNLCALAYDQVWLAGDVNNPHYLYYSKRGLPENFGPQNYIKVSSPDDPINAVINWRGTLIVGTLKTWYIIVGGAEPYAQPTGSEHGVVAQQGWIQVEGAIWYRAADGLREFTGADGNYKSLLVEWVYRGNPMCIPPQADPTQMSQDVLAYYDNVVYASYISTSGQRYRMNWDTQYARFRYDDVPATAMLWEKDTNTLLAAKQIGAGQYAIVQDQVGDYDDGGWVTGSLVQTPINMTIQSPYRDLGRPHNPKQWNQFETDVNTQNQVMTSTLLFEDGTITLPLTSINTGTTRQKVELLVNSGAGEPAYRASILHTIPVTVAPTLYQENIYATVLAEYSASIDSYWIKFGTDESKFVKQAYFDYNCSTPLLVNLYADNNLTPYFTFTLPAQTTRGIVRARFGNNVPGTTAFTMRTFRMIVLDTGSIVPPNDLQMWEKIRIEWKPIGAGHSYQIKELEV